jgi:hypothetical protein
MSFAEALFSGNKKTGTAGFFVTILFSYKLVAPVEICCASLVATDPCPQARMLVLKTSHAVFFAARSASWAAFDAP